MAITYISTRGDKGYIKSAEAIVKGISGDKGLYVPTEIPKIEEKFSHMIDMEYKDVAFYIFKKFFEDFTDEEIKFAVDSAYDEKFEIEEIVPISKVGDAYFLELYHGKTLAFKDIALSILPYFMTLSSKKIGEDRKILILVATSGDTGKAALEGFADVEGTEIVVFYPKKGVSEVQRLQMVTQVGKNIAVIGIEGNFDDAQNGVKRIFNDDYYNKTINSKGYVLSSANSINIGRLIPQVTYYLYTYLTLLNNEEIEDGEKVNFVVPTGNFGNILAGYYAKQMGLPINKLICASNENNVLTDFINTGVYDIKREFKVTNSPSMDILISSNLERLLFELSSRNPIIINDLMDKLKNDGKYEISCEMKEKLSDFYGGFSTEEETLKEIHCLYDEFGYVVDTHTAVGYNVYGKYKKDTDDNTKTIILSTASPYKFAGNVMASINKGDDGSKDEFELIEELSKVSSTDVPEGVKNLNIKEIRHNRFCNKDSMEDIIIEIIK